MVATETQVATTVDWPALERRARKPGPEATVGVVFYRDFIRREVVDRPGEDFGGIAVVPVPQADPPDFQIIHVATGMMISGHRHRNRARILALALAPLLDWSKIDSDGFRHRTQDERDAVMAVVNEWRDRYER